MIKTLVVLHRTTLFNVQCCILLFRHSHMCFNNVSIHCCKVEDSKPSKFKYGASGANFRVEPISRNGQCSNRAGLAKIVFLNMS